MRLRKVTCSFLGLIVFAPAADRDAGPQYDPATVISISGTVQEVRELAEPPALKGIHVTLVEKRGMQVYVAPAPFLRAFAVTFVKGDRLHISGSKVRFRGAELVLAREVRRDNDVLVVRDEKGNPYWDDEVVRSKVVTAAD